MNNQPLPEQAPGHTQKKDDDKVQALLENISRKGAKKVDKVIYGIYDNTNASVFTKVNDLMVDHTRIGLKEKSYFFHLMAVMIDAGIPMLQTLQVLARRTENPHFQRIINTLAHATSSGKSLSDSMARFSEVFNESEIGVIRAGEAAGNLNKMLFRLSEQIEKSHSLQVKLITAATYPLVIFLTLITIAIGMMIWIVPTLINLLKEGGLPEDQFPTATKVLIALSTFISSYWWLIILVVVITLSLYHVYRGTQVGKFQTDYMKLRIPIIGSLVRKVIVLRFVSMLGILIEAGLPVLKTLQIIGGSIDNSLYQAKTWDVIKKVQAGEKISDNLMDAPFLFPETVTQMLSIGESSASMGSISQKIGIHFDREIDHSLKRLTSLFEPLMILFVGIVVALLALAILMPIFDLTRLV
ncbi:type II secretion system F family protein [Patescibacteria group bacterium]